MLSSDSEDFESADEGHETPDKKDNKKRHLSSNHSENTLKTEQQFREAKPCDLKLEQRIVKSEIATDGWDDFDMEDTIEPKLTNEKHGAHTTNSESSNVQIQSKTKTQNTGWDDFDDWGQDEEISFGQKKEPQISATKKPQFSQPEPDLKAVADKMAATSTGGWGWGWNVDSLLSTATAGISTITSQVSQGISTVLETGIGAPDPEELARNTSKDETSGKESDDVMDKKPDKLETPEAKSSDEIFPFGGLLSGVTKFVETTGTKVISGGLDTLESIGKKTMEVIQNGDPGLVKKRAMLGLRDNTPVLSEVLRETKSRPEEEDWIREEKREAKEVLYETLFDNFEGLVHLEALEMLSKQVTLRIDERLRSVDAAKRQDIKETLQQVAELCEMPEEDEDEEDPPTVDMSKSETFHERLQAATQDLGVKLHFQPLVKLYTDILDSLSNNESSVTEKMIYKCAVSSLAQTTALSVELYHKVAEMLLVNARRSTADEADALTQMTVVLTKHISELATLFTEKLNTYSGNTEQVNNYITDIFLEAGNSSTYIQNAFQLTLPILQIGAV